MRSQSSPGHERRSRLIRHQGHGRHHQPRRDIRLVRPSRKRPGFPCRSTPTTRAEWPPWHTSRPRGRCGRGRLRHLPVCPWHQPASHRVIGGRNEGREFESGIDPQKLVPIATHFKKVRENTPRSSSTSAESTLTHHVPDPGRHVLQPSASSHGTRTPSSQAPRSAGRSAPGPKEMAILLSSPQPARSSAPRPRSTSPSASAGRSSPRKSGKPLPRPVRQASPELDPVIQKKVIGDETPITCRPAENIAPELEAAASAVEPRSFSPRTCSGPCPVPGRGEGLYEKVRPRMKGDVGVAELVDGAGYPV